MKRGSSIGAPHIVQIATGCDGQAYFRFRVPYCRIDEADHSRKARLTSTNVTTARTRAPSPSTAICRVMADKKSMAAKPNPQNSIRNGPRLRAGPISLQQGPIHKKQCAGPISRRQRRQFCRIRSARLPRHNAHPARGVENDSTRQCARPIDEPCCSVACVLAQPASSSRAFPA